MAPPGGPGPEIGSLAADLATRLTASGHDPSRDPDLVEAWTSRTSRLGSFRVDSHDDRLVVKVCDSWSPEASRTTFETARLMPEVEADGCSARAVDVVDWSIEPPAIVTRFVPGQDLSDVLTERAPGDDDPLVELVTTAGSFLRRCHDDLPVPETGRHREGQVRCAGDFAVYNLRLEVSADPDQPHVCLVYMEPPAWRRAVLPHRDIAWFLWSLRTRIPNDRGVRRVLAPAFLRGYCGTDRRWGLFDRALLRRETARRRHARRRTQRAGRRPRR